jgi:transposase
MINIGMDVHRRTTTFCAVDDAGSPIARGTVTSDEASWRAVIERWPIDTVRVALETGTLSWWVVAALREFGVEPVVVDARQFKLVAASRKKSDRRDARALADALRCGLAAQCAVTVPSERARRARALMQAWRTVVKQTTLARNAALDPAHHRPDAEAPRLPPRGQMGSRTGQPRGAPVDASLLETHRAIWQAAQAQREQLDRRIEDELGAWPEAHHLLELPGYGPKVTLAVACSVDDPQRFSRGSQVASYGGLVPMVRNSGETVRHGGITHQGRALLRHLMVQAGHTALRSRRLSPALRGWAVRVKGRRGPHVAAVALARRLLVLGFRLLKTGEVYDPNYGAPAQVAA